MNTEQLFKLHQCVTHWEAKLVKVGERLMNLGKLFGAKELLEKGHEAYRDERYVDAVEDLRRDVPRLVTALERIATVLEQQAAASTQSDK